MRAFGFEKEPVFKAMEATSIWGQLISAGASLAGAALGAKGSKNAAATAAAGNADALNAQREAYENSRGVLQPYVNRGNRAQSYLDAMLYGTGSFTDAPGYLSSPSQSLEAMLIKQNPGAWATWQGWEQKLKPSSYTKGHRAVYGDFKGFLQKTNPAAIENAQGAMQQAAAQGGTKVTRDAAYRNLQETIPWQLNEEDYLKAQGYSDDEIAAWTANAEAEQDKSMDALFNRGGLTGQVGATRRGVAQVGEEFARDRAQYEAGRRRSDYDKYSAGRLSSYGGYLDQLGRDSDRGYQAGTGIASGGQTYANNAGRLIGDGARAQAQAGLDASKAWATGIQGAVGYLGDAWNGGGGSSSRSHSGSGSYDPYKDPGGYHEAPTGYTAPRMRSSKQSNIYGSGLYN